MQFKRVFISVCLLLAYSIGLAHDLIPHCHHCEGDGTLATEHAEEHHHHHEHHVHEHGEPVDHEHIEHADHLDEGLLDFIICILDETEHPSSEGNECYYAPAITNDISNQLLSKVKLAAVLVSLFAHPPDELDTKGHAGEATVAYLPPPLSSSPHRGPPSVFC